MNASLEAVNQAREATEDASQGLPSSSLALVDPPAVVARLPRLQPFH